MVPMVSQHVIKPSQATDPDSLAGTDFGVAFDFRNQVPDLREARDLALRFTPVFVHLSDRFGTWTNHR